MATMVAEAAAAVTAAASGAFNYNRANYMFDNALRFSRYTTGYSMAMAQSSQYREDIRDLTEFTVTKGDTYHTVGVICFVLNFQLIMAGRLGVHGPSPPGWIMGLYWTNICSALMFLVTFTWLAMHSAARASAGAAHMLTRSVRLPIPTPKQLDKARTTGNAFEKQRVTDMFRIPFVTPAPKEAVEEEDPETGRKSKTELSGRRMPKWYQDEVRELHGGDGPAPSATSNPEHFELYRGLQEEWWGHDIYARIGVLYFFSHWLSSVSLYSMCHVFSELRLVWPAWTVVAMFVTAHYGVLSLDIMNHPREGGLNIPVEKVVPFVPVIALVGLTIDYSVLDPSPLWTGIIQVVSWICYLIQFAWALRLYDLASPQLQRERPEMPGQPWWPAEWQLPPAFQDAVYLVSAPKQLEPGQTCLLQEMRAAKGAKSQDAPIKKARPAPPPLFPWKLFRGACITTCGMWVLIMVGRAFETVNGETMLLKQPGRMERWPSHVQPWMPPWSRKGTRNEWCHAGGCDRRLSQEHDEVAQAAQRLVSALGPIVDALAAPRGVQEPAQLDFAQLLGVQVAWPAQFRPALLASSGGMVAALASAGHGAMLRLAEPAPTGAAITGDVAPFVLEGLEALGDIIGATLSEAGLLVATSSGMLAECRDLPVHGAWPCEQVGAKLPVGTSQLQAAVATRVSSSSRLRAAVALGGEEGGLLLLDAGDNGEWLPAGEVELPVAAGRVPHLSMTPSADELFVAAGDGEVLKWPLRNGSDPVTKVATAPAAMRRAVWHGACGLGGGRVARLATRPGGAAPELFVSVTRA